MQIEGRFIDKGTNCYCIRDNTDFTYFVTSRGLYMADVLEELKTSGYKILDYAGHILTPEGISIEEITLSDNTLNQTELDAMYTLDDLAVTEAEATAYYDRDISRSLVELKQPVTVKIKTREGLIEYLIQYSKLDRMHLADEDCLPLNSFVEQDALFTLEELQTDDSLWYYMKIIEDRRILKSFAAYEKLVTFLQQEGVLGQVYTPADVKTAYVSWGICGLKTMFTRMEEKVGVRSNIFQPDSVAVGGGNRVCMNLMDREGQIISLSGVYPELTECEDFSSLEVQPCSQDKYFELYRSIRKWPSQYRYIECLEPNPKTRTIASLTDDIGCTYKMFLDTDVLVVTTSRGNLLMQRYLMLRLYNNTQISLDTIPTDVDYQDWCLCCAKVHDLVERNTRHTDVDSTYELLKKEGMFDGEIIQYMARRVDEDRMLNKWFDPSVHFNEAEDMYRGVIEERYIQKYNPENIAYDTIDELIDIMLDTKATLESQNKYLVIDKTSAYTEQLSKEEAMTRPVEQLEFARDAVRGNMNIDYFARGICIDSEAEYIELINFLILCHKTFGQGQTMENFLTDLTDTMEFVEWQKLFRKRDEAYWGAILDTAMLNQTRATESVVAMCVTNVFRELSLEDPEKQRHYAFQGLVLRLDDKKHNSAVMLQRSLADIIEAVVDKMSVNYRLKEALKTETANIALELMFRVAFDKDLKYKNTASGEYLLLFPHSLRTENVILEIPVTEKLLGEMMDASRYHLHYCKLSDWCRFSFAHGISRMYCMNAAIDPWHVTPNQGVKINSYNFAINYLKQESYEKVIAPEIRRRCDEVHAKIDELMSRTSGMLIPDTMTNNIVDYNDVDIEVYLQSGTFLENMEQYFKRFSKLNTKAKARDQLLYKMRSKSDIMFEAYADRDSADYMDSGSDEYVAQTPELSGKWFKTIDVINLGSQTRDFAIGEYQNSISKFDIDTEAFEDVLRWKQLLNGTFSTKAVLLLVGTKLLQVFQNVKKTVDLKSITITECEALVDAGILFRLSAREFLVSASNGKYKLEVK